MCFHLVVGLGIIFCVPLMMQISITNNTFSGGGQHRYCIQARFLRTSRICPTYEESLLLGSLVLMIITG